MKNFAKAEAGAVIFDAYQQARTYRCHDKVPLVLECLLTDLMHFAEAQGVDFESCFDTARLRYDDDTGSYRGAP